MDGVISTESILLVLINDDLAELLNIYLDCQSYIDSFCIYETRLFCQSAGEYEKDILLKVRYSGCTTGS